jgi:hypothetical protein
MFRNSIIILVMLMLFTIISGEASGGQKASITKTSHDFGEIKEGSLIEHSFTMINQGDRTLEIVDVKPDCGCTTPDLDKKIPPGEKGRITLKMDTMGFKGKIKKSTRVFTNDPNKKMIVLHMEAFIRVPIQISKEYVVFKGAAGEILSKSIDIKAMEETPLKLDVTEFTLHEKVTYDIQEIEKGRVFRLSFWNEELKVGMFSGHLKLGTNYPEKPEILIKIRGRFTKQ